MNGELQYIRREFKVKDERDVMIEYNDNRDKVYEGEYNGNYVNGFIYEGKGKQFLNGEIIFDGRFVSGKREGYGMTFVNGYPRYRGEWRNNLPHGKGEVVMSGVDDEKENEVIECGWKNGYGYDNKRKSVIDMNGNIVTKPVFEMKGCSLIQWFTKKSITNHILLMIVLILCIGLHSSKAHQTIRQYSDYEELSWLDRYLVRELEFTTDCCNSIAADIEITGMKLVYFG